jgi:hypothetical protein
MSIFTLANKVDIEQTPLPRVSPATARVPTRGTIEQGMLE